MIKAIIIDDEVKGRSTLNLLIKRYLPHVQIIGEADGVESGLSLLALNPVDLIFLDIQMGDGTGFDFLEKVTEKNFEVIFVTAFDEYAIKAFQWSAVDYLLKPVEPELLISAVHKLQQDSTQLTSKIDALINNKSSLKKVAIYTQTGVELINVDEIVRFEASSNYTILYLRSKITIISTKTLKEYDEMLSESTFFRVHKSHLINLNNVQRYVNGDGGFVIMNDSSEVEVARRRKESFLQILLNSYS